MTIHLYERKEKIMKKRFIFCTKNESLRYFSQYENFPELKIFISFVSSIIVAIQEISILLSSSVLYPLKKQVPKLIKKSHTVTLYGIF